MTEKSAQGQVFITSVRGLLGHGAVDSVWFAAGFLGESLGLPLAGLGPLHVLMDIAVWGMALASGTGPSHPQNRSSRHRRPSDTIGKLAHHSGMDRTG